MNSSKNLVIGAVVLVAVVLIGWLVFRNGESPVDNTGGVSPSASATALQTVKPTHSPTPTPKATLHTVILTSQGLDIKVLTIHVGDAITFTNRTNTPWWPASDPHPTHSLCPGFDAHRGLGMGESYTLTFTVARTCTYHNHLDAANPASQGTIIVQ